MKTALKIGISALLFGAIVWMIGGINEVKAQILRINPLYILPIITLTIIDRGIMTYKWGLLLRGRGIRLPFFRGMMIYCTSSLWGLFLPSTVGADAIRAYSTSQIGIDSSEIVASIIVERFIGFLSALLLAVLSLGLLIHLGFLGDQVAFAWMLGGGMLFGGGLLVVVTVNQRMFSLFHDTILQRFKHRRIAQKLRGFHETYRSFFVDRQNLTIFFGLTFAEQLFPILDSWLVARGMGIEVGLVFFAMVLPLALLVSRIPISFDGLGVFEGIFILLMSLAGVSAAQAVAISVVSRIFGVIVYIPWWIIYLLSRKDLRAPYLSIKKS